MSGDLERAREAAGRSIADPPPGAASRAGGGRGGDLGPRAVVEGKDHGHVGVADSQVLGSPDLSAQAVRHPGILAVAEKAHPHPQFVQLVAPPGEQILLEAHEELDLLGGAVPVLGGEGEDREPLDPQAEGAVDHVEQRLLAGGVAGGAGQAAGGGPATVAVHDDGDVARVSHRRPATPGAAPGGTR
jgi:hypothetical protein